MGKHAFTQSAKPVETTEEEAARRLGTSVSANDRIIESYDLIDHNKLTGPTRRSSHNRQRIAAQIIQALRTAGFECETVVASLHPFSRRVGEG
jgi:hypothetical protein